MSVSGVDLCITFDTTGSMYPCLAEVRRRVSEVVERLFGSEGIPNLRIAIIAHGDYCDDKIYVTKILNFSSKSSVICNFVEGVQPTGGGDSPECYELVLHQARNLNWKEGNKPVIVMIGDDVPHSKTYWGNTQKIDWRKEVTALKNKGIPIYGVHAMPENRRHSKSFYEEISSRTGGYYLTLNQFSSIVDIIYAICYKQLGNAHLHQFQEEVGDSRRSNPDLINTFRTLAGLRMPEIAPDITDEGLSRVPSSRFQSFIVDADTPIKVFAESLGLEFRQGRGFYELEGRKNIIQEKKEVVLLENSTGHMWTGPEARDMIGVPMGVRKKIDPVAVEGHTVFIQSTSHNRKLREGSRFLYEVPDHDLEAADLLELCKEEIERLESIA